MNLRDHTVAEGVQSLLLDDLFQLAILSKPDVSDSAAESVTQPSRPFPLSCDDDFKSRVAYLNMENILVWGSNLMTESSVYLEQFLSCSEQLKSRLKLGSHHAIRSMMVYPSPFEIQVPMSELELRAKVLSEVQLVHLSESEPSADLPPPSTPVADPIPADPLASAELQGLCQPAMLKIQSGFDRVDQTVAEETIQEQLTLHIVAAGLCFLHSTSKYRDVCRKIEGFPPTSSLYPVLQTHLQFLLLERTLVASLCAKLARVRAQNLPLREFLAESALLLADYKVHETKLKENLVDLIKGRHQRDIKVSSGHLSIPANPRRKSNQKHHQKFGLSLSQFSRRTDGPLEVIQESKVSEVSEASKDPKSIKWDSFDELDDAETYARPRLAESGPDDGLEPIKVVVLPCEDEAVQEMSHDDLDLADEVDLTQPIGISSIKKDPNNSSISRSFKPSSQLFTQEPHTSPFEKTDSQLLEPLNPKKQDSMILSEDTEFSKEEFNPVSSSAHRNIGLPKSPQMRPSVHLSSTSQLVPPALNSNNSNQSNSKTNPSIGSNMTARYEAAVHNQKEMTVSHPKESGQVESVVNTQNNAFTLGTQQNTVLQSPLRKPADVFDSAISESQELHPIQIVPQESRMIYEVPKATKQQPLSDLGHDSLSADPLSSGREPPKSLFIPTENKNIPVMHYKMPRENSTKNLNLSASGPLHGLQSMAFSESLTNLVRGREESAPTPAFMSGSINPKHAHEYAFQGLNEPGTGKVYLNQSQFADLPYSPVTKVTTPQFNLAGYNPEDFTETQIVRKPNIPRADRKNSHMNSSSIRNDEKSGQLDGSVIVGGWSTMHNNQHETHSLKTNTTSGHRHYIGIGASSISRPAIQLDVDLSTYNSEYGNNQMGDDRTSATGLTGRGYIPMENPFSHYDDTAPSKTNVIENLGDKALALKALDTSSVFNPSCINGHYPTGSGTKQVPNTTYKSKNVTETYYQSQEKSPKKGNAAYPKKPDDAQSGGLGISTLQQPRTIGSSLIPSESSLQVTRDKHHPNRSEMIVFENRINQPSSALSSENADVYEHMKFNMSVQNQQQSFKSRAGTVHHKLIADDSDANTNQQHKHSSMHFKDLHLNQVHEGELNWPAEYHRANTTPNSITNISEKVDKNRGSANRQAADTLHQGGNQQDKTLSAKQQLKCYGSYCHFGKNFPMQFSQLKCEVGGSIQGQGLDANGVFGIVGTIKPNREVQFLKQHLGMQPIAHKGILDSTGSRIEGTWEFGGMQGTFTIESTSHLCDQTTHETLKAMNNQAPNFNSGLQAKSIVVPTIGNSLTTVQEDHQQLKRRSPGSSISQRHNGSQQVATGEEDSSNTLKKKNMLEISKSVNYADNSMKSPNESGPLNSIFRSSVDNNKELVIGGGGKKADSVFYERDDEDLASLPSPKFNGRKLGILSVASNTPTVQQSNTIATQMPKLNIPHKLDLAREHHHESNFSAANISKRVADTARIEDQSKAAELQPDTNRVSNLEDPPVSRRCQSGSVDPNILSIMKHKEAPPHKAPHRIAIDPHYSSPSSMHPSKEQEVAFDSAPAIPHNGHYQRHSMYPPIPRESDYGSGKSPSQVRFSGVQPGSEIRNSFAHHSGISSSQLKPPHYHSFGPVYESGFTLGRKRGEDSRKSLEESGVSGRVAQAITRLVSKLSGNQLKSDSLYLQKDLQRSKKHLQPNIGSGELFASMNEDVAMNHTSGVEEDTPGSDEYKLLAEALALLVKEAGAAKTLKPEIGFNSMVSGDRETGLQASASTAKLELELAHVREEAANYKRALEDITKHNQDTEGKLESYKETLLKSQKETEFKILNMMKEYQTQVEQLKGSIRVQESLTESNKHKQRLSTVGENSSLQARDASIQTSMGPSPLASQAIDPIRLSSAHFFSSNLLQSQPQDIVVQQMMRRSNESPMLSSQQPMLSGMSRDQQAQQSARRQSRQKIAVGAKNLLDYYKEELDRKNFEIKQCELNLKEEKRRAERLAEELDKNNRELSEKKSVVSELEKQCENLSKKNIVLNMSCERLRFSETVLAKDFDSLKEKYWRRSLASSPTVSKQLHRRGGSFDRYYEPAPRYDAARISNSSRRESSGTDDGNTDDSQFRSGARALPPGFLKLLAKQKNKEFNSVAFNYKPSKTGVPVPKRSTSPTKQSASKEKLRREVCLNYGDSLVFPFTKESAPQLSFVRELKKGQSLALMKKYAIDSGIKSFGRKAQKSSKEGQPRPVQVPKPPEDRSRPSSLSQKKAIFFEQSQAPRTNASPSQKQK